ncbi:AAA domain protein [Theileria parva strain Muguga]|uniref:Uncharacterized protein n=1 Tax=Theileria parva TaxID=5875 RepID=Q4N0J2_THEPA|nr:AAA domain protein [Theileria parva strain Muguga]EAN30879.1 AAA domain protein [Theileria parva strain Muguga]|eukprot:XP_763162.1 hypothetical protein [Theileria parva strain Muguga]
MSVRLVRPKTATLDELLSHEFYKRLVTSIEDVLPEMKNVKDPKKLINSKFSKEIVEIYEIMFLGSFNKLDMASLEHSDYLSHLLPCLSMDSFPLIANLDKKSQENFKKIRFCTVMTCVWSFVELHSSGRSEYVDVLSNLSSKHKDSFETLFFNSAQLLMLESWKDDLCESREFESVDRITVLEQRALLRFFVICFQRIELSEVRRCCMSLLSPQVWIHIPEELREHNFFKNNKVSKALFLKAFETYKLRHKACNFDLLLKDPKASVRDLYELVPNKDNMEHLNLSYKLVLARDFMNSLINQFIYILEDHLSFSELKPDQQSEEDPEMMRLMYIENYLELFVDLLSQLHLRRVIKPIIEYKLLLVRCKNHPLYEPVDNKTDHACNREDANIFIELVNILEYYLNFNINEELGTSMEYNVILEDYYKRFNKFQRVCYLNYKDDENLKNIHLVNNYALNNNLSKILGSLDIGVLVRLNQELYLIQSTKSNSKEDKELNGKSGDHLWPYSVELLPKKKKSKKLVKKLLISNLTNYLKKPINELMLINNNNFYLNPFSSLFNNITTVTSNDLLQPKEANRREVTELGEMEGDISYIKLCTLSLFKLNLQYLTMFDYLYRNFILYQFEVIYQIKQYVHQQIFYLSYLTSHSNRSNKLNHKRTEGKNKLVSVEQLEKRDWVGRMFICIDNLEMKIDQNRIEMMLTVDLSMIQDYKIRQEWQQLTKYDILFLVQLNSVYSYNLSGPEGKTAEDMEDEVELLGKIVKRIRFGEILEVYDEENNNVLDFNPLDNKSFVGFKMRIKLLLDYQQYMKDMLEDLDYYSSFNLIIRRSKRQNNFKSILSNVQNVVNHKFKMPSWLQVILLGYFSYHSVRPNASNTSHFSTVSASLNQAITTERDEIIKKRKKEQYTRVKIGVVYLNTFKSKDHLLSSTSFISIKLVPCLNPNNTMNQHNFKRTLGSPSSLQEIRENRIHIDSIDTSVNEYVYNNKGSLNKAELAEKLKSALETDKNINLFVKNHIYDHDFGNESGELEKEHLDERSEYVVLNGVKFELHVENNYLNDLTKVNNDYHINSQLPKFLITNFNHPYDISPYNSSSTNAQDGDHLENNSVNHLVKNVNDGNQGTQRGVKFVSRQVESIIGGTMEGLTVIMGPPGTGKTDVVSQIISILFNNYEHEKIVICTHSNFALNDIFTKLVKNELIDEHYMVRLGHSDLEVDNMGHFSKFSRVNYILQRRLDLLEVIKTLKEQIKVVGDYECSIQYSLTFLQYFLTNNQDSNNCYLNSAQIGHEKVNEDVVNNVNDAEDESGMLEVLDRTKLTQEGLDNFFKLGIEFPYTLKDVKKLYNQVQKCYALETNCSNEVNGEEFKHSGDEADKESCKEDLNGQLSQLKKKFIERLYEMLFELLPFEILRNNRDRMKYLVENYSRIVAMTCTHASISQEELSTLNYKTLVFEEAAQILEIESFIPICNNIKRLILCGDHLQLSPIIQNSSLLRYSNLNQSLFLRLIRLNYPYIQLNVQARSRPEILSVYSHFYPHQIFTLDGLFPEGPEVSSTKTKDKVSQTKDMLDVKQLLCKGNLKEMMASNLSRLSLKYVVQFIDVEGEETSPIKYFYQNLGEATYCVLLYMLMRLMGLEDIVILTAYNGQKCLIEDIVKKRCSWNNKIGSPFVSTIDKFQGRQADYVIVSMVRTKNIGYLRDPRRFVVATSRSRLGLWIVGSKNLVQNIKELSNFNEQLNRYPNELYLNFTSLNEVNNADSTKSVKIKNNSDLEELVKALL